MGSAPHARRTKRHCPKSFRRVRRDSRCPFLHHPHPQIKRNHPERSLVAFLNSRIPRRLYLVRRVRSRHQMTHPLSLTLYSFSYSFYISAFFFIERTFLSLSLPCREKSMASITKPERRFGLNEDFKFKLEKRDR